MHHRKLIVFALIAVHFVLALVALQLPVDAAPLAQRATATPVATDESTPLRPPLLIRVQQQLPVTLVVGAGEQEGATAAITQTVAVTLDLDLQLALTQTLTTAVRSTVTLTLADGLAVDLPISLTLGEPPPARLVITPLSAIATQPVAAATATRTPTATSTRTATSAALSTSSPTPTATLPPTPMPTATTALTPTVTATLTPTTTAPAVVSTVNITANLRAGPSTDAAVVGQAGLGQPVRVVAISADGLWYLLDTGQWIAIGLVSNPPANPPVATDALIASLLTPAAPPPTATAASLLLPTPTPTLAPPPPAVIVNANLRAGPGTEFAISGGTISGQTINIVGRNQAGDWFLLDNGGWVSAPLVANPPDLASVPVVVAGQPTPAAPVTTTAPITAPVTVTVTTPITTPATVTTTVPVTPVVLSVSDNLYLIDANELIARYNRALTDIDRLLAQARQNPALLQDQQWVQSMTTAIALIRATDTRVRALQPTPLLAEVQTDLGRAADAYDAAASLLTQGIDQANIASFDQALAEITGGSAALDSATDRINALTP